MEVNTVDSAPPAPPVLPKSVPSHLKGFITRCTRAAKLAWISESRLAEFPDEDLTDEHLDKLYKAARWKLNRHQKNPKASATTNSMIAFLPTAPLPSKPHMLRLDR